MKITDDVSLRPLQADDAKDIYETIDAQREYLGRWLPFDAGMTSVAITQAYVDSTLSAEEQTFTIRNDMQIKCAVGNTPSSNIPKRLGFQFEGVERAGELFADGEFVDLEIYSLLKNDK